MKRWFKRILTGARKAVIGLIAAAAATAAVAATTTNLSIFTSPTGTNPVYQPQNLGDYNLIVQTVNTLLNSMFNASGINAIAGLSYAPMTKLNAIVASSETSANTSTTTLASYSLPANALDTTGRELHIHAGWGTGADGNNKTGVVNFGSNSCSTGAVSTNNGSLTVEMDIVKTGASTQNITCLVGAGTALVSVPPVAGSNTDTAAITITATGLNGTAVLGDIYLATFDVVFKN